MSLFAICFFVLRRLYIGLSQESNKVHMKYIYIYILRTQVLVWNMVVGRRPSKCASWKLESSLNDVTIIIISFILHTGEYRVQIIFETKKHVQTRTLSVANIIYMLVTVTSIRRINIIQTYSLLQRSSY